ncbi:50S ribosomal protein L24 [Candidatus Saccharibacteria bacterium]|nr:50S ribosomal protein L24 [Candidatus Saccharibacteria bacterium]NIV03722.1 50S ribosomal protein L24 [Calditrichia bacterium]NIV72023.1 50S ribosomal protein L24 [Calditrichia bacterium]NIV98856.1 50S ribosomal protein L24 [Candidatus Saccharibacteria bacterium]NIW79133.1 50S ribosomal protein L24 [Calditrichia bacterium]
MKKVQKNDTVLVTTGDGRGKRGKVLKVFPKEQRIIVEGVNIVKRHTRPTQQMPQGGIISVEAPIHVSNVKVIAPKSNVPTRVGVRVLKDGSKVRFCKHPDAAGEELI